MEKKLAAQDKNPAKPTDVTSSFLKPQDISPLAHIGCHRRLLGQAETGDVDEIDDPEQIRSCRVHRQPGRKPPCRGIPSPPLSHRRRKTYLPRWSGSRASPEPSRKSKSLAAPSVAARRLICRRSGSTATPRRPYLRPQHQRRGNQRPRY